MQAITCMGPAAAPLPSLKAAAPASPKDVEEDTAIAEAATAKVTTVAAAAPAEEEQLAVQAKERAAVLSLARELRRPRAFIGYIVSFCSACAGSANRALGKEGT